MIDSETPAVSWRKQSCPDRSIKNSHHVEKQETDEEELTGELEF